MKVPKHIKDLIKCIEKTSLDLKTQERELYTWLDSKGINTDFYDNDSVDNELHSLFEFGNGNSLVEKLEELDT